MAYYIHTEPVKYDSMFSALWHRVGSDNYTQPNFRFVLDIYVGGVQITRLKLISDAYGRAQVDVSRIIRDFAESVFSPQTIFFPISFGTEIFVAYDVQYGEEYGPAGAVTTYANLVTHSFEVSNAYVADDPAGKPFAPLYGKAYDWLTSRNTSEIWTSRKHPGYITFFNDPVEQGLLEIRELNADGHPVGGSYQTLPFSFITERVIVLDLSYYSIVGVNSNWNSAPNPVLPVGVEGYQLQMYHADFTPAGPHINVRFLPEGRNAATGLHFLNRFGGFDTFYFSGPARREVAIERKSLERTPFTYGVGGSNSIGPYSLRGVYAESTINYVTAQTWTRKLNSGLLDDRDALMLSELLTSPQIYLDADGWFIPVTITDNKWSERMTRFDKAYALDITIQQGRKVTSQTR